jgi:hypothetical protein
MATDLIAAEQNSATVATWMYGDVPLKQFCAACARARVDERTERSP